MNLQIENSNNLMALAYFCKRITFNDAYSKAHGDTKTERTNMAYRILAAISDIEKSLEDAGYSPR